MPPEYFDQEPYHVRFEWGPEGARHAAARGDVLVIVDVLCFSTAVATAAAHGAVIYPCGHGEDPTALAQTLGAERAVAREEVPTRGRFSLSPGTFLGVEAGTQVVLHSANGAVCARAAEHSSAVLIGALVNATAVAREAERLARERHAAITVIACGERWPGESGLRVALEDALGAGAVLAALPGEASPEARVCAAAFQAARGEVESLLWDCASCRELRARGFAEDVRQASRLDLYDCAPRLHLPVGGGTCHIE